MVRKNKFGTFYYCLSKLLTKLPPIVSQDPRNPATDFVNIVTINRESSAAAKDPDSSAGGALVQGALNSLRIIAQLTQ
jgi:hypothetical protein